MIERPYRSGAQHRCLMERQSLEIQKMVLEMVEKNSYNEIVLWLCQQGIEATWSQVRYFVRKSDIPLKKYIIHPKKTYPEKLDVYVHELLKYESRTFTIHTLHMRGSSWTAVTVRLHKAGLIHPLRQYPPIQWKILGTKDEIRVWRDAEIKRITQGKAR